jgi:hypothetical protein
MIGKIISDSSSEAGLAALDLAVKMDLLTGGYTRESTAQQKKYHLQAMPESELRPVEELNVADANGVLLLVKDSDSHQLELLETLAKKYDIPLLLIDIGRHIAFEAAHEISSWIDSFNISTLYVTGDGTHNESNFYQTATDILETVVYMGFIESSMSSAVSTEASMASAPVSLDDAVERLLTSLPLKDRATIANMTMGELPSLVTSLGSYILKHFGLWAGNTSLLESCRFVSKQKDLDEAGAADIIIHELWKRLTKTHKLRLV